MKSVEFPQHSAPEQGLGTADAPAEEVVDSLRQELAALDETARVWVREHPLASVLVAAGAGFLVGRIAARRL